MFFLFVVCFFFYLHAVWRSRVCKQRASGVLSPHHVAVQCWQSCRGGEGKGEGGICKLCKFRVNGEDVLAFNSLNVDRFDSHTHGPAEKKRGASRETVGLTQ